MSGRASLLTKARALLARRGRNLPSSEEAGDDMRFRRLIEANAAVILQIDPDTGRIRDANAAAESFYGWSREALRGMSIQDIRQDDPDQVAMERERALSGERRAFVARHRLASGAVRAVEVHSTPIPWGRRQILVSIIHDVSQRLEQERRIAELLREQKAILDSRAVGMMRLADRRCVWVNVTAAEALGYHVDELVGMSTQRLFPEGGGRWEAFEDAASAALARGEVFRSEAELVYRHSGARWFELTGAALTHERGDSLWTLVDITARKEAEMALVAAIRESDELYNQAPGGYHSVGADGRVLKINDTELRWLGYAREEVVGRMTIGDLLTTESAERAPALMAQLIAAGRLRDYRLDMKRKDGSTMPALFSAVAVYDAGGAFQMSHSTVLDWTDRVRTEAALQRESEKNLALLHNASDGIHILDEEGDVVEASDSFCAMLGYTRDEVIGMNVGMWDVGFETAEELRAAVRRQFKGRERAQFQSRHRRKDGSVFDVEISGHPLVLAGRPLLFNASRDITDRRRLEAEREEALRRLQKIARRVPGLVYQFRRRPDGTTCFPFASEGIRDIYGVDPESVRDDTRILREVIHPEDLAGFDASTAASARDLTPWRHEYRVSDGAGGYRWVFGDAMPEREPDGGVLWHGFISDITERKRDEAVIAEMAFHDMLTRLPNRRLLADRLKVAMAMSRRSQGCCALLLLDIDDFKGVNDNYGHAAGDALLIEVAARLTGAVRETDTIARVGGDEFVVVLTGLDSDTAAATTRARLIAEAICARLSEPYRLTVGDEAREATITPYVASVSIGVTLFRGPEVTADDLLTRSDRAMYQAKRLGGGQVVVHKPLVAAT